MDSQDSALYYERLGGDFYIEKKTTTGRAKSLPHIHTQYEMLLCLSDDMRLDVGDITGMQHYSFGKKTLLLFNNMDWHHFYPAAKDGDNTRYVCYFDPQYIDTLSTDEVNLLDCFLFRPFPAPQILHISEESVAILQSIMDRLLAINSCPPDTFYGKSLYVRLLLAELLLNVNSLYRKQHQISASSSGNKYRTVYAIISYIHANYTDEITLESLASNFFINKFYLCEIFKKVTGVSPNQYIINCRLMHAKDVLSSGHTVEEACALSGFNNMSHFSRIFKARVGVSPKQYQKQMHSL